MNTARGIRVNPGRYQFNEYFIFWNTNSAARVSVNSRFSTGEFYDGYRRAYNVSRLLQYNTDSQQWSSNVRFNIIHRPLSDIFLVYNERRDERTGNLLDRAFVAKMTYLVAF